MTPRSSMRLAATVAGFALVAAACGSVDDSAAPAVDATPAPEVADAEPEPPATPAAADADSSGTPSETTAAVPAALQFSAPLVGGGEIDAADLSGKPTAFWFWSPT